MGLKKTLITVLAAAAGAILLTGYVVPIRLEVDVDPLKLNKYDELTRDDVTVYLSPLFKRGKEIKDFVFSKETNGDYDDITVQQTIFYKKEHIRNVLLDHMEATYGQAVREGDPFDPQAVTVTAYYKDGTSTGIMDYEIIDPPETIDINSEIIVKTDAGSTKLDIQYKKVIDINASYEKAYEGDNFDPSKVIVTLLNEDGTEEKEENFSCEGDDVIRGETVYIVYTSYGKTELDIIPTPILYATTPEVRAAGTVYRGDVKMVYEDGTELIVGADEITYGTEDELTEGVNQIPISWKGMNYTLFIPATQSTPVAEAANTLEDEIAGSIYNEVSSNLFLTIRKIGPEDRQFFITHIVLGNPSQLYVETANRAYGAGTEAPFNAATRTGWVLGINGSYFDEFMGTPLAASVMIRNGQIIQYGATTGFEICLTNGGALFSPPAGVSADDLIAQGVRDILMTTAPLLIQDGTIYSEGDTTIGGVAPHTAVGMVRPGEYYIVTTDAGLTYGELQSVFAEFGCKFARPLDGGRSTALYFGTQAVNNATGREVVDFLAVRR